MCEFYTEKELARARRKAKVREWTSETTKKIKVFWNNNKTEIIAVATITVPLVTYEVKTHRRDKQIKAEQHLKDCFIYDHSIGDYWELKRKLNKNDRLEIERRRASGERLGAILVDMNLAK